MCCVQGLELGALKEVMSKKQLKMPREVIELERTKEQSQAMLRSLCVLLYQRLFQQVLREMDAPKTAAGHELGILDMYGFENLESNSLEQPLGLWRRPLGP